MVVCPYNGPGHSINGESISDQEYVDLRKSLNLLKDLMEKQNIPIFETIPNAVTCAAKIIYERDMTQYVNKSDNIFSQKINNDLVPLFEDTFNTLDTHKSGTINLNDLCIAYDLIYGEKVAMDDLETTRFHYGGNRSSSVSFIQFCSILERRPSSGKSEYLHDLYLIGEGPEWKENIAKPLLRNHGLSYFIPEDDSEDGYTSLCKSRVLLFVISENSRALTTMTRAAFAIGIKANIILCIQSLRLNSEINGCEKVSP
ncbi:hypothetical protein M8J77_008819 [Diaphorina citri]|nr:hypothetical protein M8J77_008819 [Diaphorina citri]